LKFPKWHCSAVAKEKGETRLARQTLAGVIKEMNKPVMTASVKRFFGRQNGPSVATQIGVRLAAMMKVVWVLLTEGGKGVVVHAAGTLLGLEVVLTYRRRSHQLK
jgi:hypothetical protein